MQRIGIAASKIAKGNLLWYNLCVVLIAFVFSMFVFILAGSTVILSLIMISYIGNQVMAVDFEKSLPMIMSLCMVALTVMLGIFNLMAISINIKLRKKKR